MQPSFNNPAWSIPSGKFHGVHQPFSYHNSQDNKTSLTLESDCDILKDISDQHIVFVILSKIPFNFNNLLLVIYGIIASHHQWEAFSSNKTLSPSCIVSSSFHRLIVIENGCFHRNRSWIRSKSWIHPNSARPRRYTAYPSCNLSRRAFYSPGNITRFFLHLTAWYIRWTCIQMI